jgi:hypothetical protein
MIHISLRMGTMLLRHPEPYGVCPLGGTRQMTVLCAGVCRLECYHETGAASQPSAGATCTSAQFCELQVRVT